MIVLVADGQTDAIAMARESCSLAIANTLALDCSALKLSRVIQDLRVMRLHAAAAAATGKPTGVLFAQ